MHILDAHSVYTGRAIYPYAKKDNHTGIYILAHLPHLCITLSTTTLPIIEQSISEFTFLICFSYLPRSQIFSFILLVRYIYCQMHHYCFLLLSLFC